MREVEVWQVCKGTERKGVIGRGEELTGIGDGSCKRTWSKGVYEMRAFGNVLGNSDHREHFTISSSKCDLEASDEYKLKPRHQKETNTEKYIYTISTEEIQKP